MEKISARDAFNKGLTRYFTGKICSKGHIDERMISNGCCVSCLKERNKRSKEDIYEATKVWRLKNPDARRIEAEKYRKKYPEKVKANVRAYRERNLEEVRKRERENAKRMRVINPEKEKDRIRKYKEKQEKKRIAEAGRPRQSKCELCKEVAQTVFDHCHINGHFRGWICDRCNRVLGSVKDDINLLYQMINYLEKNRDKINIEAEK